MKSLCFMLALLVPQALEASRSKHGADMRAGQSSWILTFTSDSPPSPPACHFRGSVAPPHAARTTRRLLTACMRSLYQASSCLPK